MPEVWTFNANGDIPEAARDQINLQAAIVDDESVSTTGVGNVIAELPNGAQLEGFHSVDLSVDGTDLNSPLNLVNLHWRAEPIDELAQTATGIADALEMDPADIEEWAAGERNSDSPSNGAQVRDDIPGLSELSLQYRGLGTGDATVIVTMVWPRNSQ